MRKWLSIWFIPGILFGVMIGIWNTTYTPKFKTISPIEDNRDKTVVDILVDKRIELKLAPKSDVFINGAIGGVLGWIITKSLDHLVFIIRRRKRNVPKNKSKI